MKLFTYAKVHDAAEAVDKIGSISGARFIAGGTNMIDLMKESVVEPDHLLDITEINLAQIESTASGGIKIGALAKNSDVANHKLVRSQYPVLSRALLSGASPQLRNMATVGGNLLQRTRCAYFYDINSACNKRKPGSGCDAIGGYNRMNAILGGSKNCIAVHPSDMCVALAALDATVHVTGPKGDRAIPINEFYVLPAKAPQLETVLSDKEFITAVELPPSRSAKNWTYLKIRDRASYAFALVSVAAVLEMDGQRVKSAKIALGGVAPKPWRATDAEKQLQGKNVDAKLFATVADTIFKQAKGYEHNNFKIELGKRAVVRALKISSGGMA